jgi:hypothetical protein
MESSPLKQNETDSQIFRPSKNIILLPAGLSATGLLLFLFFQFVNHSPSPETNFLGWGFILLGIIGLVLNIVGTKKYRLCISDTHVRLYSNENAKAEIEIPLETISEVKVHQTAIAKFLHYGNLSLRYGSDDLFLQDIDQPDNIAAILAPLIQQPQE